MASGSSLGIADATYRRLRLDPPAQCVAQAQKAANIGRHIQALEDTHRELMAIQDRLDFANKVYTFARIVKDTSVAFLDLAGAIAGGKAATVGSLGVAAIDTATSVSEVAHGQGDALTIALRTANSANSVLKGPGAGGTFGQMSGQQAIGMAQTVNDMRGAPSAGAGQQKAAQGAVNLMADTVKGVADMAATSESDRYGKAGRVAAIIKAAYGYKAALNDTIEQRIATEYDIATSKAVYLHNNRLIMERYRRDLREAMDLLNQCQGQ